MQRKILIPIYMQANRPELCCRCNMLVERPKEDLTPGTKFTHFCLMMQKPISGRGTTAIDPKCRMRCKPKDYHKTFVQYDGEFPLSLNTIMHYKIDESKLPL